MVLVIPDPPAVVSSSIAGLRRNALQRHLATQVESLQALRLFRELPDRDVGEQLPFLEGPVAAAEFARLRWQSRSMGLLLLERAIDVLEVAIRNVDKSVPAGSVAISLEPLPIFSRKRGKPPWRVVVRAPNYLNLRSALERSREFFGIGVELRAQSRFQAFARCMVGDGGLDGVVGGVIRSAISPYERYLATCAHVIATGCGSLEYPKSAAAPGVPDAVLLRETTCFNHPGFHARRLFAAEDADTARLQLSRVTLVINHPDRRRSRGWLKYPVGAVLGPGGQLIRFPHYSVQPFRYRIACLRWPPFRNHFAVAGDSGSWVVEQDTNIWVGMVIGGYDDHSDTLVADGRALLDYYTACLTSRPPSNGAIDLEPYSWT